jgi:endonuclease/exonuclease/phosphatase family metal-dependent hydrolase
MQTLAKMALGGEKTILLGDFNFTDQNQDYRVLTQAGLADAHRSGGWGLGLTYPKKGWSGGVRLPLVRIDFVFLTGDICAQRAWVGEDGGSDHLPVLADVAW